MRTRNGKPYNPPAYTPRYQCVKCGSFSRMFVQCVPCTLKFIEVTDVAAKSRNYEVSQLYAPKY